MEHRAVTPDLRQRYLANVVNTYMSIGRVGPNAEAYDSADWSGCRSIHKHPTSNFAFVTNPSEQALAEVRDFAQNKKGFLIYSLSGPQEEPPEASLRKLGFGPMMNLQAFIGAGSDQSSIVRWEETVTKAQRLEICHFMVDQFFYVQTQEVRDIIALSTAASGLPILRAFIEGQEVGAALCPRTPGMVGLYNLCVPKSLRRRGFGAHMVRALLNLAEDENTQLALQCGRQLVGWYEGLGLNWVGILDIWCLESR